MEENIRVICNNCGKIKSYSTQPNFCAHCGSKLSSEAKQRRKISVAETARLLGKCPQFVRMGLQQQRLPFGVAVKGKSGRWSYDIAYNKLMKYLEEGDFVETVEPQLTEAGKKMFGTIDNFNEYRSKYNYV